MRWNRAALAALLVFAAAAQAPGCGGSDNDPAPPSACLDFVPDAAPAAGTVVARKGAASTCNTLVVEVAVSGFNDVFAGGGVVTHTGSLMRYDGMDTSATFLADGGVLIQSFPDAAGANPATTGIARASDTAPGVNVGNAEVRVLYGLTFTRTAASGTGRLTFSNAALRDSTGAPNGPQIIPGSTTWAGGDLIIN